jgi:hypothetical protein
MGNLERDTVLTGKNLNIACAELLGRNGLSAPVCEADYDPVPEADGPKAIFSFAAVFAEWQVQGGVGVCVRSGSRQSYGRPAVLIPDPNAPAAPM